MQWRFAESSLQSALLLSVSLRSSPISRAFLFGMHAMSVIRNLKLRLRSAAALREPGTEGGLGRAQTQSTKDTAHTIPVYRLMRLTLYRRLREPFTPVEG